MQRPLWLLNWVGRELEASNACRPEGEPSPAASAARGREAAQREGTQEGTMADTHCVPGTAGSVPFILQTPLCCGRSRPRKQESETQTGSGTCPIHQP